MDLLIRGQGTRFLPGQGWGEEGRQQGALSAAPSWTCGAWVAPVAGAHLCRLLHLSRASGWRGWTGQVLDAVRSAASVGSGTAQNIKGSQGPERSPRPTRGHPSGGKPGNSCSTVTAAQQEGPQFRSRPDLGLPRRWPAPLHSVLSRPLLPVRVWMGAVCVLVSPGRHPSSPWPGLGVPQPAGRGPFQSWDSQRVTQTAGSGVETPGGCSLTCPFPCTAVLAGGARGEVAPWRSGCHPLGGRAGRGWLVTATFLLSGGCPGDRRDASGHLVSLSNSQSPHHHLFLFCSKGGGKALRDEGTVSRVSE